MKFTLEPCRSEEGCILFVVWEFTKTSSPLQKLNPRKAGWSPGHSGCWTHSGSKAICLLMLWPSGLEVWKNPSTSVVAAGCARVLPPLPCLGDGVPSTCSSPLLCVSCGHLMETWAIPRSWALLSVGAVWCPASMGHLHKPRLISAASCQVIQ